LFGFGGVFFAVFSYSFFSALPCRAIGGLFTAFGGRGLFLFLFIVQGSEHLKGGFFRSTGAGCF
jgi:hypothetical protein